MNEEKLGSHKTPVKSNITDPDSAKMTTSKGTIQGYNSIAINDDKHQIILQAQTWGSVGEQQTLKPAIEQLQTQLTKLGTPETFSTTKFTADSGFHSEINLEFMASTGLDAYMADSAFRSRNPLFSQSETYQTEQEKRRLKRSKGRSRLFNSSDFHFDEKKQTCHCSAGKEMWLSVKDVETAGRHYVRYSGYLKDCRVCPLQTQCMRKKPTKQGRQVQFETNSKDKIISYTDKMRVKIDSSPGRREYSKRLGAIEPVFGNITVNKGMNKFTLRGQDKVNTQWKMYCLVHNIEKLRNSLH